ncbi:LacI family DNA-binding transcriptional regulator [Sinomonas sp. P47F7]|uniref:LacI family DNA-binding transcriptional regulator n=1 Tax=Sinomonas sp. P47F7 TaxID=3410987 RepID=UPI003BF494A4
MAGVTLQTIADQVGVSRMTVSNAYSRPDQLSPALREKILKVGERLGYSGPDPAARALKRGSTGAFGLLLPASLPSAFKMQVRTEFLAAVAAELASTGMAMTLLPATSSGEVIPARDVAVDGVVVYGCDPRSTALQLVRDRGIPLVYVDQEPDPSVESVNIDDYGGAFAAAAHLTELGHRRIGILTFRTEAGAPPRFIESERERGWTTALTTAGVTPVVATALGDGADDGLAVARRLLEENPDLTGVLCFSDIIAGSALAAAAALGRRVPEDLSVVGFDDDSSARLLRPALTTIRQDVALKGRTAAAAITAAVRRRGKPARAKHTVLPAHLVIRSSTAPAPASSHVL